MPEARPRKGVQAGKKPRSGGREKRMPADGSPSAADALVTDHLDLVEIATRSVGDPRSASLDRDDLIGEGQVALVKAARRYDSRKGSFRAYAFRRIRGAMLDALRRDHFLSRHARERGAKVALVSMDRPFGAGSLPLSASLADERSSVEELVLHRETLSAALAELEAAGRAPAVLTPSELEVLRGAAAGETAVETAARLRKSIDTVKSQRRAALRRLGARSIAHAVFIARDEIAA
jgi:RNA polymerase sigma factor (sigma-70 family)